MTTWWASAALVTLQVLLGLGVARVLNRATKIEEHLSKLNGRTGKLEEWRDGHVRLDDEAHRVGERERGDLRKEVERLRSDVTVGLLRGAAARRARDEEGED